MLSSMLLRILMIVLIALPLAAQEKKSDAGRSEKIYKLDYVLSELDGGKRVEARDYSLLVDGRQAGRIRIGNRVPIIGAGGAWQYMDVGVNIDAAVRDPVEGGIALQTKVEVTAIVTIDKSSPAPPTMRNFRTENEVVVLFGKPTTLFIMDEPGTKRSFQIHVTATQIK